MASRSLTSTLRSLGRLNGSTARSISSSSSRSFCNTPAYGVRAIFAETDNAELNEILSIIQEKIVLPAHLPEKQRKMVFDPKKRSLLQQNPVIIEVDGLEHKFSPLNRFTDIENSKIILNKALQKMETTEDWNNLGTLLAGYKKAGIKLKANHWGKVVRVAGTSGNIYTVIECAKQADETGLFLTNRESVVRILAFVNDKITNSNSGEAETKQALRWAELVLDLLQRPEHTISGVSTHGKLHFSRLVRGMVLFTRASVVEVKQQAGEDVEQDIILLKDDVDLLNSLWEGAVTQDLTQLDEFAKLNPVVERNASSKGPRIPQALNGSAYVQVLAQNIRGLALTREILGEGANTLKTVEEALDTHLQQFVQSNTGRAEGWSKLYEDVVGQPPNWPTSG